MPLPTAAIPQSVRPLRASPSKAAALILACMAFPIVLRLSLVPWATHLPPAVHDEFSYVLAADTFASGRLTNPPHRMWKHFESFQEIQQPTYASKYPPGQGMILAVGQVLFGDPLVGAWISAGLMCGAICWMLQAWLPTRWVLVGVLLAVAQYAIGSYWMEGYWGGALTATGGALTVGAIPRLLRAGPRFTAGLMFGIGLSVLAMTRPYEGSLLAVAAGASALWLGIKAVKAGKRDFLKGLGTSLIPAVVVLAGTAGFLIFYNWRVTGHPLEFPYMVYEHQYRRQPLFRWQPFHPPPHFNNHVFETFYDFEHRIIADGKTWRGYCYRVLDILDLRWTGQVLLSSLVVRLPLAILTLGMMPWLIRQRNMLLPVVCFWVVVLGISLVFFYEEHYAAPITGVKVLLAVEGMRRIAAGLWRWLRLRRLWRPVMAALGLLIVARALHFTFASDPTRLWSISTERPRIIAELNKLPGKQLVIVRYRPLHDTLFEWVYNAANIDQSKVVWARELDAASNTKLLRYFHDRQAWLLEPDAVLPRLQPYRPGPSLPAL